MTIEELYNCFCSNFKKDSTLTRKSNNTEWTKNIYSYFYKHGIENSFQVYAKPNIIKEAKQEYLVDLCWSKEEARDYFDYRGLELILESEWLTSEDELMWDFCKLIDMKAFLKVMIICIDKKGVEDIIKKMAGTIKSSRIKFQEENYLVIIFVPMPSIYNPDKYIIEGYKINYEGIHQRLKPTEFSLD